MKPNNTPTTIGIVEPHPIVGRGLKNILEELNDFRVIVTITDNCQYFFERVSAAHPDILIIDPDILDYKRRGDVEYIMEESNSEYVIALVTQHFDPEMLKKYHAVIDISDNREKISNKLKKLIHSEKTEIETNELTVREKEILVSVAKGMMNKEIADKYNLSIHTVITHRKNITKKTGIKSVSGLTVFAILNNLIDIQDID